MLKFLSRKGDMSLSENDIKTLQFWKESVQGPEIRRGSLPSNVNFFFYSSGDYMLLFLLTFNIC
jgi:hypothetical protein